MRNRIDITKKDLLSTLKFFYEEKEVVAACACGYELIVDFNNLDKVQVERTFNGPDGAQSYFFYPKHVDDHEKSYYCGEE